MLQRTADALGHQEVVSLLELFDVPDCVEVSGDGSLDPDGAEDRHLFGRIGVEQLCHRLSGKELSPLLGRQLD